MSKQINQWRIQEKKVRVIGKEKNKQKQEEEKRKKKNERKKHFSIFSLGVYTALMIPFDSVDLHMLLIFVILAVLTNEVR